MAWPTLQMPGWAETRATLHMWTQIVGKTRLALAPFQNHWWHVPLYVSARGLTTSPMPWGERTLEVEFDFHRGILELRSSEGRTVGIALASRPVAEFYREYMAALDTLGVKARFLGRPVEVVESIPFAEDFKHATYDPAWARALWDVLQRARNVFERFRSEFIGKASPVHFFWGALDLAVTRFSGRPGPPHPGGAPNCADYVMLEGYSHELSSAGFWPGDDSFPEAAFYSYAYPEPQGFARASPGPAEAVYSTSLREFVLPYEKVRILADPAEAILQFLRNTYAAAATLGKWDRAALERVPPGPIHR